MRYSIKPRDKRYRFLSFAKNIGKNLSGKCSQKLLDSATNQGQLMLQQIHKTLLQREQFIKQQK